MVRAPQQLRDIHRVRECDGDFPPRPYLWTCWCALQSPSCAGGLLQLTIVMADCRRGPRVAVARVQIDVRMHSLFVGVCPRPHCRGCLGNCWDAFVHWRRGSGVLVPCSVLFFSHGPGRSPVFGFFGFFRIFLVFLVFRRTVVLGTSPLLYRALPSDRHHDLSIRVADCLAEVVRMLGVVRLLGVVHVSLRRVVKDPPTQNQEKRPSPFCRRTRRWKERTRPALAVAEFHDSAANIGSTRHGNRVSWHLQGPRSPAQLTSFCPAPLGHLGKPANGLRGREIQRSTSCNPRILQGQYSVFGARHV
jgi:hypothetical protein